MRFVITDSDWRWVNLLMHRIPNTAKSGVSRAARKFRHLLA